METNKFDNQDWTLTVWVGGKPGPSHSTAIEDSRGYLGLMFERHGGQNTFRRKLSNFFGLNSSNEWEGVHDQPDLDLVDSEGNTYKAIQLRVAGKAPTGPGGLPAIVDLGAINNLKHNCAEHGVKIMAAYTPRFSGTVNNANMVKRWGYGMATTDPHGNHAVVQSYQSDSGSFSNMLREAGVGLDDNASINEVLRKAIPLIARTHQNDLHGHFSTIEGTPHQSNVEEWRKSRSEIAEGPPQGKPEGPSRPSTKR